ncbi:MAG: hypothetical protein Q9169_003077 [Polycauliona sp. 2 TL-2023]
MFRLYCGSADLSARMLVVKPHIEEIREHINEAKMAQDMPKLMQYSQEMKSVYLAAGIKIWRGILPFLNVPLGYGFFRLGQKLAAVQPPGLDEGGILWFTDLTVSDPTFLLPMATGVATFYMFKFGGELGSATAISGNTMKFFQWGMPIFSAVIMSLWPAVMQVGFFTTSLMALGQSFLFKQPWFRRFVNIHPLPPKDAPSTEKDSRSGYKGMVIPTTAREVPQPAEAPQEGVFGSAKSKFKSGVSDLGERTQKYVQRTMDQSEGKSTSRRSAAEVNEAKKYDEKRKKEIQQAKGHREGRGQSRR